MKRSTKTISVILIIFIIIAGVIIARTMIGSHFAKKFGIRPPSGIIVTQVTNQNFSAYIRLDVIDKHGVLSNITNIFSKNKVSIKRLIQNPIKKEKYSSIIIITHSSKDINLSKTLKNLSAKKYINKKPKIIRIENI